MFECNFFTFLLLCVLLTMGLDWFVRFPLNIYYSDLWPFFKVVFFFNLFSYIKGPAFFSEKSFDVFSAFWY